MNKAIIPQRIRVYTVNWASCFFPGQLVFLSSNQMFFNFIIFLSNIHWQAHSDSNGELRFWRPLFYQLKLWAPSLGKELLFYFGLLMQCMFLTFITVFFLLYFIFYSITFKGSVVFHITLGTFKSYNVSFCFCHLFSEIKLEYIWENTPYYIGKSRVGQIKRFYYRGFSLTI